MFKECGQKPNPTLGVEIGTTYIFDQTHNSNYLHPLGLAYYPDGAHNDLPELRPNSKAIGSKSSCEETLTCAAGMHYLGGEYVGTYSNNEKLLPVTTGEFDFGLFAYGTKFKYPLTEWINLGEKKIFLKLDDEDSTQDMFYFCHVSFILLLV